MIKPINLNYEESVYFGNLLIAIINDNISNIKKQKYWSDHYEFINKKCDELLLNKSDVSLQSWMFHPKYIEEKYDSVDSHIASMLYNNAEEHIKVYLKMKWGYLIDNG